MAMPRFTGGRSLTRAPSMRMSPEVVSSRPAIIRSSVDFPQPEGPTKTTNSPSSTSSETLLTTSMAPKLLTMLRRASSPTGHLLRRLSEGSPRPTAAGIGGGAYLYASISAEALSSAAWGSASPVTTDCTMVIMAFWKPL